MLRADAPGLIERFLPKLTTSSPVEEDLYYLMVIGRLPGVRSRETTARVAGTVAAIHHKMIADGKEPSRFWPTHVGVMFSRLLERDAGLGAPLVDDTRFTLPAQALFAARLALATRIARPAFC